jgi:hypothetical protein
LKQAKIGNYTIGKAGIFQQWRIPFPGRKGSISHLHLKITPNPVNETQIAGLKLWINGYNAIFHFNILFYPIITQTVGCIWADLRYLVGKE